MAKAEGSSGKRVRNDFETFIRAWETSDSVQEAADKCGITKDSAGQRASQYRSQYGIDLKKMQRGQRLDVGDAQDFLAALRAENEQACLPVYVSADSENETEVETEVETETA